MVTVREMIHWYALGKKGNNHIKKSGKKVFLKENRNVTAVQNFLSNIY